MDTLFSLLSAVPQVVILAVAIYYVTRRPAPEGILMVIGAGVGVLARAFYAVLPVLARDDSFSWQSFQPYLTVIGLVSTAGTLAFAIGLLLLVQKVVKNSP